MYTEIKKYVLCVLINYIAIILESITDIFMYIGSIGTPWTNPKVYIFGMVNQDQPRRNCEGDLTPNTKHQEELYWWGFGLRHTCWPFLKATRITKKSHVVLLSLCFFGSQCESYVIFQMITKPLLYDSTVFPGRSSHSWFAPPLQTWPVSVRSPGTLRQSNYKWRISKWKSINRGPSIFSIYIFDCRMVHPHDFLLKDPDVRSGCLCRKRPSTYKLAKVPCWLSKSQMNVHPQTYTKELWMVWRSLGLSPMFMKQTSINPSLPSGKLT